MELPSSQAQGRDSSGQYEQGSLGFVVSSALD